MNPTGRYVHRFVAAAAVMLFCACFTLAAAGCAAPSRRLDAGNASPQLIVNPCEITLGVARVLATPMVFEGMGFEPEERVMVVFTDGEPVQPDRLIPLAFGAADSEGRFAIEVKKTMKIYNLLNAEVTLREKGAVVVVSGPPLPAGRYTAEASGYTSGRSATCPLLLRPPCFWDRLKDRIAEFLGKIERE